MAEEDEDINIRVESINLNEDQGTNNLSESLNVGNNN